ncbi:unnamed protein product [Acanthoscelides obtectus]|uniref:Uncharacterized protein n=1 Tax=Acanthoscelides obtectus TaxID=200917 RepID=A0A9P0QCB4_ACAOB|nr:unnamed protein product [Acanthoscelides obtectus]CAK1684764.1 hypothetical protein AOBTE_LOCUS35100 [Acanthoscelides obtectus]
MIVYPGKFVKGDYRFLLQKGRINTLAYLEWDTGVFNIDVDILYDFETKWFLQFTSKVLTPFDHWKKMTLDGRFDHEGNKYDIHGVMSWNKRERVAVDIFGDYTSTGSYFTCKYSCSIASSIDRVPNINTTVSHRQNDTNFDTNLFLMYNPEFVIGLDSQWRIESDNQTSNLTGTIHSRTPFKGLANGVLVGKISIKDNYMKGYGQLDIDHKKMSIDMEGRFKKLTNCMLMVNLTAPESEYKLRFVISAEQRTFIAMLTYPTGSFGTEVIFLVHSLGDFDTKFHLATPVEFLQDIIVAAKLKPEEADFRVGWNFLLLGFSGVWHYANVLDFHYSYKIYTPIEDFDENGVVGRLVFKEGLDLEASAKLSKYKVCISKLTLTHHIHYTIDEHIPSEDVPVRKQVYRVCTEGNEPPFL